MKNDVEELKELNIEIGDAENRGDHEWLAKVLAPRLAFQKSNQAVEDREAFLQAVSAGGDRATRVIEPVQIYGDRAVVQCVVTKGNQDIHNLRLFVRLEGEWKLLGWANQLV